MPPRTDSFEGLHVLLVTEDDARAQAIAKALRERKAHVGDVRAGSRDPVALRGADLLVIDARRAAASEARINEVRSDVRARWASVASIDYAALAADDGTIDLRALEGIVSRLAGMDKALTERARKEPTFEATLAPLGPTRTLRALALAGPTLHVELSDGALHASVDLADELLVAAFAERDGQKHEAWLALARVLGMTDATIKVERKAHPTAMNIMEPVDQALEMAAQERARAPEVFAQEEREQVSELSGLRREPLAPQPALPEAVEPLAVAQGGEPVTSARMMPPRQRTLVGVPAAIPPASMQQTLVQPSASMAAAALQPPPAPEVTVTTSSAAPPGTRPSMPDQFADIPTDPAAPGLLQRMARKPANDTALPQIKNAPAPQLSYDGILPGDDDGQDDEANEVTVIADASQLDLLRETLERIDAPADTKRMSSTMPAPPGAPQPAGARSEPELELVRGAFSEQPLPAVSPSSRALARSSVAPSPSEQSAAASAFGSIPPPPRLNLSGGSLLPGSKPVPRGSSSPSLWLVIAAILAVLAIAAGVYWANSRREVQSAPPSGAPRD